MTTLAELSSRFEGARTLDLDLTESIEEITAGSLAAEIFPDRVDLLEALFMLSELRMNVDLYMRDHVDLCRFTGHSWNEIALALGVSRQAARKRFGSRPSSSAPANFTVRRPAR